VDADRSPRNVRVVPDLGDELLIAIDRLEALLGSVAVWEIEDDVGLPAPFADGKALGALQTVRDGYGYGYGSAAVVAGGGSGLVEAAEQRAGRRVLAAMLGDDHGVGAAPLTMTTCRPLVDASSATPP
jgi:hypothetical protein